MRRTYSGEQTVEGERPHDLIGNAAADVATREGEGQPQSPAAGVSGAWAFEPPRVLLVADAEAPSTQRWLARLGQVRCAVDAVVGAEQALDALATCAPDLLLISTEPFVDGASLASQVAALSRSSGIPALMVGSEAAAELFQVGLAAGAVDGVTLSISEEELDQRLRMRVLQTRSARARSGPAAAFAAYSLADPAARHALIVQELPFGVALLRLPDGTFLEANPAFHHMTGHAEGTLLGATAEALGMTSPGHPLSRCLRAVETDGRPRTELILLKDEYGQDLDVQLRAHVHYAGEARCVLLTLKDASLRVEAQRQLHQLSLAIANASESVVITTPDNRVEYVNAAFTTMTGYAPEEVLGRAPADFMPTQQPPETYRQIWAKLQEGRAW